MKKFFQYKNNEVVSYSDAKIICGKLEQKEMEVTQDELNKMNSGNYDAIIKGNKLEFRERDIFKIQKQKEQDKEELKLLIEKAKEKYSDLALLFEKLSNK